MKKYLILCFILVVSLTSVNAQDKDSGHECKVDSCAVASSFAPHKGDFTVALALGRGAYFNSGLVITDADGNVSGIVGDDPRVNANSNSITNMVGIEGRFYITNRFAVSLTGGAIVRNTPTVIGWDGLAPLPGYNDVIADNKVDAHFSVGGQWLFPTKNERLFPYLGFALPYSYARRSILDPSPSTNEIPGMEHVEVMAWGAQAVAGIDFYVAEDFYIGFDAKPVSYNYATNVKTPSPGLVALQAETNTVSFFAQFGFKIGFKL